MIIDVRPDVEGLPTTAYEAVEEVESEGKEIQRVFKHIRSTIEAEEAEEVLLHFSLVNLHTLILSPHTYTLFKIQVGVEHLLRDINDPSTSTLALQIKQKLNGLSGLVARLEEIRVYLVNVIEGRVPTNNQITYNLQNIFNLLPNLNIDELIKSMLVKTNDMYLVMYLSSLVRAILALHGLLTNKIRYRDLEDILDKKAGVEIAGAGKETETVVEPNPATSKK